MKFMTFDNASKHYSETFIDLDVSEIEIRNFIFAAIILVTFFTEHFGTENYRQIFG